MRSATHTPGPWKWKPKRANSPWAEIDGGICQPEEHCGLARVVIRLDGDEYPQGVSNARLIAAAPELLDALRKLLLTSKVLLQRAEGCAGDRYGVDPIVHGPPGWIADCANDIESASIVLRKAQGAV